MTISQREFEIIGQIAELEYFQRENYSCLQGPDVVLALSGTANRQQLIVNFLSQVADVPQTVAYPAFTNPVVRFIPQVIEPNSLPTTALVTDGSRRMLIIRQPGMIKLIE